MSSEDVWQLVRQKKIDYNKTYDIFNKTKNFNKLLTQRVCPPFGEEPLRGLWVYAQCFPEMWHKMLNRVDGVATAWRYANTELFSANKKPEQLTWKKYLSILLSNYKGKWKKKIAKIINASIKAHYGKTNDKLPDGTPHLVSGCSYKFLCMLASRGDFKGRRSANMINESQKMLNKMEMSLNTAKILYGKK